MKEDNDIIPIRMYIPQETSTGLYDVRKVGDFLYELTNNDPFNEELIYKTIIEVLPEKNDDGHFIFKRVYKESEYTLEVIHLPTILNQKELRLVGQMIVDNGGFWEVIFGGLGYVNLPKGSKLNVCHELNKLIKLKQESGS